MKFIYAALIGCALVLPMTASAGKDHKYLSFGTGNVVLNENARDATITNDPGEYGGLYATKAAPSNKLKNANFSFKSDGDVQGGAPRWSIPIDTNGNRNTTEGYAFLDAANCGADVGTNDSEHVTVVSTRNDNCKVFLLAGEWDNWAAFAADNPSYRVSKDIPFIVADAEAADPPPLVGGVYHVYKFQFG